MEIYLLRHGIAEDPLPGHHDAERPLTDEGRKKLRQVLERAHKAKIAPGVILSSPYLRAVQTAELAAATLGVTNDLIFTRDLRPESEPEAAWAEIRLYKDSASVLCASHEPLCGRLAAFLLNAPSLQIEYKKGMLACIEIPRVGPHPRGILKWLLTPRLA